MRRWAIAGAVVVLALGALFVLRPFMAKQRDYPAEIPSPSALQAVDSVPLAPGRPVCFRYAVAEAHSQQARFKLAAPGGPAGKLRLTLQATDGSGYHAAAVVPAGAVGGQLVSAPVVPPSAPTPLRVCIANEGTL